MEITDSLGYIFKAGGGLASRFPVILMGVA